MEQQVFLQVWKLSPANGSDTLNRRMDLWAPEMGFGVWPNRRLAGSWNEEMLMNSAAAVFSGREPELPSYRLLRVAGGGTTSVESGEAMAGTGAVIQTFARKPYREVAARTEAILVPTLPDGPFGGAEFFLPLLDAAAISAAEDAGMLETWLGGLEVYVRESAEDGGVLILSRLPLEGLLAEVARTLATEQPLLGA